jgi:hypothetical protein
MRLALEFEHLRDEHRITAEGAAVSANRIEAKVTEGLRAIDTRLDLLQTVVRGHTENMKRIDANMKRIDTKIDKLVSLEDRVGALERRHA